MDQAFPRGAIQQPFRLEQRGTGLAGGRRAPHFADGAPHGGALDAVARRVMLALADTLL
jgi:hypothetical protein